MDRKDWANLATELREFTRDFPEGAFPDCYDAGIGPCCPAPFDGARALNVQAELCDYFFESELGDQYFPFTSHFALCISRYDSFPEFIDEAYLRLSPHKDGGFGLRLTPSRRNRERGSKYESVHCPFERTVEVVKEWMPKLESRDYNTEQGAAE